MTNHAASYSTPFGAFDTWEDAAAACERMDMDPCDLVKYVGPQPTPPALVSYELAPYGTKLSLSFQVKVF